MLDPSCLKEVTKTSHSHRWKVSNLLCARNGTQAARSSKHAQFSQRQSKEPTWLSLHALLGNFLFPDSRHVRHTNQAATKVCFPPSNTQPPIYLPFSPTTLKPVDPSCVKEIRKKSHSLRWKVSNLIYARNGTQAAWSSKHAQFSRRQSKETTLHALLGNFLLPDSRQVRQTHQAATKVCFLLPTPNHTLLNESICDGILFSSFPK